MKTGQISMCTVPFLFLTGKNRAKTPWAQALVVILLTIILLPMTIWAESVPSSPIDQLAQELAIKLSQNTMAARHPRTLVVNIVDANQLHCTSRFGQILPERLKNYLQANGWKIMEARRALKIKMQKGVGQFILSDELMDLARNVRCEAILTGTYLFHMGTVMVNMNLIRLSDNEIISSAGAEIGVEPWILSLLQPHGYGCKSPRAFLKIRPWKDEFLEEDKSSFFSKEEQFDDTF